MNLRGHLSCWCCKIPWWTRGKMVSTKRMLRKPIMMNLVMMNHENPSIMMIILINRNSGNLVDIYVWSSMDERCVCCCVLVPFSYIRMGCQPVTSQAKGWNRQRRGPRISWRRCPPMGGLPFIGASPQFTSSSIDGIVQKSIQRAIGVPKYIIYIYILYIMESPQIIINHHH